MATRTETDSFGPIEVPADCYWAAQTQRSIENFPFGANERMPIGIVRALAVVKQAAAQVNRRHGLKAEIADALEAAAARVAAGDHDDQFPLVIWQTRIGSGTQSNMNANEVIAGIANEALTGRRGSAGSSQRSCQHGPVVERQLPDRAPTWRRRWAVARDLLPALGRLREELSAKAAAWDDIVKIGRTHLQDATR